MGQGIVIKIWNIRAGTRGRTGSQQIGSSVRYITNEWKCSGSVEGNLSQIGRKVTYVTDEIKTMEGLYVGVRNLSGIENAVTEMMQVKDYYGKTGGRVALHGVISLDQEESAPENAGKLMMLLSDLLAEVWPEYQAVYAVHTNTENLHIHFILNTVGLHGKKIHMDKSFMRRVLEPALNRLAVRYGFTPNRMWAERMRYDPETFVSRKIRIRQLIDEAIEHNDDFDSFLSELKGKMTANLGEHLFLRLPGMSRSIRSECLGAYYSLPSIQKRIRTKRDPLEAETVGEYLEKTGDRHAVFYVPAVLKKYRDMTPDEKEHALRALRQGRNPWRERYEANWQMQRIAEDLDRRMEITETIRFYAPETDSAADAMQEIIRRQKELAADRKAVRAELKAQKSLTDLFHEMQKYEVRAYLYEFAGASEYEGDYEKYRALCDRMWKGYSKRPEDVARFLREEEGELLYAKEQERELSKQYRSIRDFLAEGHEMADQAAENIFSAVGHSEARREAREKGVFRSRTRYITSDTDPEQILKVLTMPGTERGKPSVVTTVLVLDSEGTEEESFSSEELGMQGFNDRLYALQKEGFRECHVSRNMPEEGENRVRTRHPR